MFLEVWLLHISVFKHSFIGRAMANLGKTIKASRSLVWKGLMIIKNGRPVWRAPVAGRQAGSRDISSAGLCPSYSTSPMGLSFDTHGTSHFH